MTRHSVNNNTRMGLVISLCSNSNHFDQFNPPRLPKILDIYSAVALYSFDISEKFRVVIYFDFEVLLQEK